MEVMNYCRMTQEALNNSIKHSETDQMDIEMPKMNGIDTVA